MAHPPYEIPIVDMAPAVWSIRIPFFAGDEEFGSLTTRLRRRLTKLAEHERSVCVLLVLDEDEPECRALKKSAIAFWRAEHELLRTTVNGVAVVTTEQTAKGGLAAFAWRTDLDVAVSAHATLEHALNWARRLEGRRA